MYGAANIFELRTQLKTREVNKMTLSEPALVRTPRGLRLHIGIFGRRNVGKSSLINALTGQQVAVVSDTPGTTTDPVYKPMELQPLGPVVFIDTPGLDDMGALGQLRVAAARKVLRKVDLALLILAADDAPGPQEKELVDYFRQQQIPYIIVHNKIDLVEGFNAALFKQEQQLPGKQVFVSVVTGNGIDVLREEIKHQAPIETRPETIVGDLISPDDLVIMVTTCDIEAPAGRLILPQVQTLRDLLDNNAQVLVVKEDGLADALAKLKDPPALVITDSQVFKQVAAALPPEVPLTSFSILFARYKGDLDHLVEGVQAIKNLQANDKVLIAEACTHHPIGDDIGRNKIPRALEGIVGAKLDFSWYAGSDFPENLSQYKLIIHCGSCMINRREMLVRQTQALDAKVPMVNYGVFLAYAQGILPRTLAPLGLDLVS